MKKKMITLVALAILTVTAGFANGSDISKDVLATFTTRYAKAANVKWEKTNNWYSASFQLDGKSLNALFSTEGDIIAVSQNVLSTELPAELETSLRQGTVNYWITDLVKYTIGDELKFYVTVENANEKVILENIGSSEWSVMKKQLNNQLPDKTDFSERHGAGEENNFPAPVPFTALRERL